METSLVHEGFGRRRRPGVPVGLLSAALGLICLFGPSSLGQWAVNYQRKGLPSATSSVRYGATQTRLLPSEARYRRSASGLLPSENRYLRIKSGYLPSSGGAAHLAPSVRYGNSSGIALPPRPQGSIRHGLSRSRPTSLRSGRASVRPRSSSLAQRPISQPISGYKGRGSIRYGAR